MPDDKLKQLEIVLLGLLVFVLPSLETPKTIFWALYVLAFLVRRYREHGLAFDKPNAITFSVVALFLVSLISTFSNWPLQTGFRGAFDTLRFTSLFLCLYYGGYTYNQIKSIALVMILGSLAGLLFGLLEYSNGVTSSLGYHSAGVTTQSSIYLGLVIITNLGLLVGGVRNNSLMNVFLYISLFLMGVAIVYMGSRGAIFATSICFAIILVLTRSLRNMLISSSLLIAISISAFLLISAYPTNINEPNKKERFSSQRFQKSDNERLVNWQIAVRKISTGKDMIWGIGPKNYSTIDPRELSIDLPYYIRTGKLNHAHNLFLTQWIEQGLMGLFVMLLCLWKPGMK